MSRWATVGNYGKEIYEREKDSIERWGCWFLVAEVNTGDQAVGDNWKHADSIGMCVYLDPLDPFQNCYVIDLMSAALEQIPQPGEA